MIFEPQPPSLQSCREPGFRHFKRQNLRLLNTDDYGIAETPIETGAFTRQHQLEFGPIC